MKRNQSVIYLFLISIAFVGISATALLFSCDFYRLVPLYVSLLVMFLQTKANRLCFLLGGLNCVYYAFVYFTLQLYGLALYSLCAAFPIQLITYLRWKRNPYRQATILRRLSPKQRLGWAAGLIAAWIGLYFLLAAFGSEYLILDNTISIIFTASNICSLLSLIEFPYVQTTAHILNITLYSNMIQSDPKQWTYLVYSVYALICSLISVYQLRKLYVEQHSGKDLSPTP